MTDGTRDVRGARRGSFTRWSVAILLIRAIVADVWRALKAIFFLVVVLTTIMPFLVAHGVARVISRSHRLNVATYEGLWLYLMYYED